jgi:hypothetical protein
VQCRRSAGRLLLHRGADQELVDKAWEMIEASMRRRHDQGRRQRHAQGDDRGSRRCPSGARRQGRGRDRRRQQVPLARKTSSKRSKSTTTRARRRRSPGSSGAREPRRNACQAALAALTEGREGRRQPARARGRGGARPRHAGRDFRRDGGCVRPLRHAADSGQGHLRQGLCRDDAAMPRWSRA